MRESLEAADRNAELLARSSVTRGHFKKYSHRANRFGGERNDRVIDDVVDQLARILREQSARWQRDIAKLKIGGGSPVDRRVRLHAYADSIGRNRQQRRSSVIGTRSHDKEVGIASIENETLATV